MSQEHNTQLLQAAAALCARIDLIHNDPLFLAVWSTALNHGVSYEGGPTYEQELKDLKQAVAALTPKPKLGLAKAGMEVFSGERWSVADQLHSMISELEGLMLLSGDYLAQDHAMRDRLTNLIGEAQDCFTSDEVDEVSEKAEGLIANEFPAAFQLFAPPFCEFGDRSLEPHRVDFGFWILDTESIKEQVDFYSTEDEEYPPEEYIGEWLHINERGNCTLYVREPEVPAEDTEIWGVV